MKNIKIISVVVLLFTSLISQPFAQHRSGQVGLGMYGSSIKLIGGAIDGSMINYSSGLSIKYSFSKFLTGEINAGLGWVRPRDSESHFQVSTVYKYRTYIYPWSVNLRCNIFPNGWFVPYIGIGTGITYWNLRDISQGEEWFPIPESGKSVSGTQSNFSLLATVGTSIFITKGFALDLSIHYTHLLDQRLDNIGNGDINTGVAEVRLGFGIFFGGYLDSDGDGIEDKKDLDPYHKEDFDGFEDEDGAPDPDNDKDGIPDYLDKAPNLPEDIDGFEDEDGVPDLDNDQDGINDTEDKAPNAPEDFDGFEDEDGVPDLDNDKDGIPDYLDKAPNQPETFNGYQDEDGVPDEKPKPPIVEYGKPLILKGVTFQTGKADLTENAKRVLDIVAESLMQYPEIEIEIRGYTDSVGSAAFNLNLSQRRAEAVRDYLVQKGIALKRLRAIGYGEANPIASNKTKEGRAKNRRIEFIRIEK